jgi:hypothetical protein
MNRTLVVSTFGGLVLLLWLLTWGVVGSVERPPQLLTGELWQSMSPDAKVAFVWGIGNLVEYERAQTGPRGPKSFIPLLVKGLAGKPINDVVRQVDAYYETHPDQLKRSVVDAIFKAVVIPAVKTEQGGKSQ